jgi:hypothetical protein
VKALANAINLTEQQILDLAQSGAIGFTTAWNALGSPGDPGCQHARELVAERWNDVHGATAQTGGVS